VAKIFKLTDEELRQLMIGIDNALIERVASVRIIPSCAERRKIRCLLPGAETVNPFYEATPAIVQEMMDQFAKVTERQYHLFDYSGHPKAERVVVIMVQAERR